MVTLLLAMCLTNSIDLPKIDPSFPIWQSPKAPLWPSNLHKAYRTPEDMVCVPRDKASHTVPNRLCIPDTDVYRIGLGWWLPDDRANATGRFMQECLNLPTKMQYRLDVLRIEFIPKYTLKVVEQHAAHAEVQQLESKSESYLFDWKGGLWVGSFLIGIAIGYWMHSL